MNEESADGTLSAVAAEFFTTLVNVVGDCDYSFRSVARKK